MWAFAVHDHHHETLGADTACQICQFGTYGSAALPAASLSLTPVVLPVAASFSFTDNPFIALLIRANEARAPPAISRA